MYPAETASMVAKISEIGTHVTVGEQALVTRAKFKLADDLKVHQSASICNRSWPTASNHWIAGGWFALHAPCSSAPSLAR